jgi:riboflavin kinase/FMN adenylyltransferase
MDAEVERAAAMLGRAYTVRGQVVKGEQRGRGLGFPTANLDPENEVLPAPGVYAGRVRFLEGESDVTHPAVTNVGTRPTFDDSGRIVAEAHLIDFDGDLYGRRLEFSFEKHLRPEQRFADVDALRRQIRADVDAARQLLADA